MNPRYRFGMIGLCLRMMDEEYREKDIIFYIGAMKITDEGIENIPVRIEDILPSDMKSPRDIDL